MIIDGAKLAESVFARARERLGEEKLTLAVLMAPGNEVSERYVAQKRRKAEELGVEVEVSSKITAQEVERLARDPLVHGMIVQLPLPEGAPEQELLDAVPVKKDVDVLSSAAFGRFALGVSPILPPTVAGVAEILGGRDASLRGRTVLLVGAGRLVGTPLSLWFSRRKATVLVANSSSDIAGLAKQADIVVSGVGKPGLITGDMITEGAVVIDAGTSVEQGVTVGDVDTNSVAPKAAQLAPVPGGLGPLTVACLLENLVVLAAQNRE